MMPSTPTHPLHISYQPSFATDFVQMPSTVGFVFGENPEVYRFELLLEVVIIHEPPVDDVGKDVKYCQPIATEWKQASLVVLAESDK